MVLRVGYFAAHETGQKLGISVLCAEPLEIHGSEVQGRQGLPQGWKIDAVGVFLTVNDLLLLHVESDHREFSDARFTEDAAQNRYQGAGVDRLERGRKRVLRSKVD